jgi:hypothetical protein
MTQEQAYATWWWEEGSGILPLPTEDMEEFAHRITQIAWSNAAYREREALAQTQEPVAWRSPNWGHSADEYVYRDFDDPVVGFDGKPSPNNEPLYTTPPQRTEQNFCPRCGKRTADLTTIHTCTPPQD